MEGGYKRIKLEGQSFKRIPFKVCSADRTVRKGVVSGSFMDLLESCIEKFDTGTNCIKVVLNDDGTEIDDDYFDILEPNTVLMLLRGIEVWTPEGSSSKTAESTEIKTTSPEDKPKEIKKESSEDNQKIQEDPVKTRKKPSAVTFVAGWKHYSFADGKYCLQKGTQENPNSGQRVVQLPRKFTYDETLNYMTDLFFKDGKNEQGNLNRMSCFLGNSKGDEVPDTNFSMGAFSEECRTKSTRIYLCTKPPVPLQIKSPVSDEKPASAPMQVKFPKVQGRPAIGHGSSVSAVIKSVAEAQGKPADSIKPKVLVNTGTSSRKCPVCDKRDRDAFIIPCGDSLCMTCGTHLMLHGEGCPRCRGLVQRVRLIHN